MVSILLLIIIYVSFISLGLPDSMLGAAWPMIYPTIGADVSMAGIISMTGCIGTVISSLSFSKISKHFSTKVITSFSIFITSLALFLMSKATSIYMMLPISLLLGLGGGCVDSALNNYVSLHYSTGAMSFLHGFWGVGTTIGPILLGVLIPLGYTWRTGYSCLSLIQAVILVFSILAFPLWTLKDKENQKQGEAENKSKVVGARTALKRKGAVYALLGFFSYCALENTVMVWNATYMVSGGLSESKAASFSSLFFWGMTIGRIMTGFIADKLGDSAMNRIGGVILIIAIILTPFVSVEYFWIVLLLIGLGCAPFYPMMMHQTPRLYGVDASPSLIGLQMASAYVGSTLAPTFFGFISKMFGMWIFPLYLIIFFIILIFSTENKRSLLSSLGVLK